MEMAITITPVGIDVSKKKLDVFVLSNGKGKAKVVDNTIAGFQELIEWLGKQKVSLETVHICMESTGVYSEPPALWLHDQGLKVSVVNPGSIKGFGQSENIRNKNDQIDAGLIARFCLAHRPPAWEPPSKEQRQLRGLSDRVLALKDMRHQESNRIEALQFMEQLQLVESIKDHVKWLDKKIAELEKDIDDHRSPSQLETRC